MAYKYIKGVNWYYRLLDKTEKGRLSRGMFSQFPRSTLAGKMVVSWSYFNEVSDKTERLYALFKSYLDFAIYYFKFPQHMRCFYELILGEYPQKPHFDLDLDLKEHNLTEELVKNILNNLLNTIIKTLSTKNIELDLERDMCVYSSHGTPGRKDEFKRSYHIVINNHCHANNKEAKAFYYCVIDQLPKEYSDKKWLDHAVYSATQQFRTLGSQKINSNRIKILNEEWILNGQMVKHKYIEEAEDKKHLFLIQLDESVVGARTSTCKIFPSFDAPEIYREGNYEPSEAIDIEKAKEAMELLAKSVGLRWGDPRIAYKFDKIEGPFVVLKRMKPSKCKICNRIHEHQNPYLWISNNGNVYFHCRRAPKHKKLHLGRLSYNQKDVIQNDKTKESPKKNQAQLHVINWNLDVLRRLAQNSGPKTKVKLPKKENLECDKTVNKTILDNIRDKINRK